MGQRYEELGMNVMMMTCMDLHYGLRGARGLFFHSFDVGTFFLFLRPSCLVSTLFTSRCAGRSYVYRLIFCLPLREQLRMCIMEDCSASNLIKQSLLKHGFRLAQWQK